MCERLLADTGVAILPGQEFGRPAEELTARLAYVNFNGEQALAAARQLEPDSEPNESFLQHNCPETIEAVDRICNWVTD